MDPTIQTLLTIFGAVIASGGFWGFVTHFGDGRDAKTEMLKGLGHDRIISLCSFYLERGEYITVDEYENLQYLFKPYRKMKGNGSAERMMGEVEKCLKIVPSKYTSCGGT